MSISAPFPYNYKGDHIRKTAIFTISSLCVVCLLLFNNCTKSKEDAVTISTPDPQAPPADPGSPNTPLAEKKLVFAGVGAGGIFDPSVTKDPASGFLWMSYSAVDNSVMWPTQNPISVHIRLAYSADNGETWIDAGAVNHFEDVNLSFLSPPLNAGTWVHETSTIVYDPGAAANQRWKLMWHTVLKINGDLRFEHTWMALNTASTPQGLLTATTTKFITSYLYDTNNNSGSWPTQPPIAGAASIQLDTALTATLNTCILAEPSLFANANTLYMALQCEKFNDISTTADDNRWIVLLKCASPCTMTNVSNWSFVAKIFEKADGVAVDPVFSGGFSAPAITETSTGTYLIVTPTEDPYARYRGCRVYKFSNIETGQLEMENGAPKLYASLGPTRDTFNGACGYIGGSVSGILRSHLGQANPSWDFQILLTRIAF